MDLWAKIYNYCERGSSAAFWAEPVNAISNAGFLVAALIAAVIWARTPRSERGFIEALFIALVAIIGIGSFLFHTYATRWASFADVAPIGVFMLAYFAYALRRFAGLPYVGVALALAGFIAALKYSATIECDTAALLPITAAASNRCLNGTVAYGPAFIALALMALTLAAMRHPAWRLLALASVIFAASMTARTLDFELCSRLRFAGAPLGTHALWHLLNALMLYCLLLAALRHGRRG